MLNLISAKLGEIAAVLSLVSVALAAPAVYEIAPPPAQTVISAVSNSDGIDEDNVWQIIDNLIQCESLGRRGAINPKDIDGRPKYGELQYDIRTWKMWENEFDFKGDPMDRQDAIQMTRLALLAGYGYHWGCYKRAIVGIL